MRPSFLRHLPTAVLVLLLACEEGEDGSLPTPPPPATTTVTGFVRAQGTDVPLAGATVSVGDSSATTAANGGYTLTGIRPATAVTIRATLDGYDRYRSVIAVPESGGEHDIRLGLRSFYEYGDVAVLVPRDVPAVRAVILTLGGPDTRAVATTDTFDLPPVVRDRIRILREWYLPLTVPQGVALMGAVEGLRDGATSDDLILQALRDAAAASGHPELAVAPLLVHGISGGAPETFGFALRHPERTVAFILRIPSTPSTDLNAATQQVPGYVILAQNDGEVDNAQNRNFFDRNRAQGARWGFVVEPGVNHFTFTSGVRTLMAEWVDWALATRLQPGTPSLPLVPVPEASGWLGNIDTGANAAFADFTGDRTRASWLPTAATATAWRGFGLFND